MTDAIKFKVDVIYGFVKIDAWFTPDGIGMGRKRVYDNNGNLVSDSQEPTGAVICFPK